MAISFLQEDIDLTEEEFKIFYNNRDNNEFEVCELGTFSFISEGEYIFNDDDRRQGIAIFYVENEDNESTYRLHFNFFYSDCYEIELKNQEDQVLYAISKAD